MVKGPLAIGELLDRAVTIFVRNAWLLLGLAALVYIPVAIAQAAMSDVWLWYINAINAATSPRNTGGVPYLDPALAQRIGVASFAQLALWIAGAPLVTAAIAYVASMRLREQSASFGDSLRFALTRWGRVVVFVLLWIAAAFAAFFALTLVIGTAVAAFARSPALIAVMMIVLFLAFALFALLAFVCGGVGLIVAILEPRNAAFAFATGIARTMNRHSFWRSALLGLIYLAISMGFSSITSVAGIGMLYSLHSGLPLVILNAMAAIVQFAFGVVFMVLYYYDLRVRHEGVDLEALAARLSVPPAVPVAQ